ncbi:hypothetical protein DY000_02047807 [Brassica cretica]|uniref:Uncharacterized protein n=1 Tax=Brassica cretica TaxID=69181 RepID=A0ABQ7EYE7_BRACR|nr:hypothetical protein DY000_02047807 [Brassica cretica]
MDELTGADGLAHSSGDSWWSAHLSFAECSGPDQCGRVRAFTEPFQRTVWDYGSMSNPDQTKQPLGSILGTIFPRESPEEIVREKRRESGRWLEEKPGVVVLDLFRQNPDRYVGSDLMALNRGLGQLRNDAHGLSQAVHDQDPYGLGTNLDRGKVKEL